MNCQDADPLSRMLPLPNLFDDPSLARLPQLKHGLIVAGVRLVAFWRVLLGDRGVH